MGPARLPGQETHRGRVRMVDTPNPYQAPLEEGLEAVSADDPSVLFSTPMRFEGRVGVSDHRDAIVRAGIRKDYSSMVTSVPVLSLAYLVGVAGLMALLGQWRQLSLFHLGIGGLVMVAGLSAVAINQRWFLANVVPAFQLLQGEIRGAIDSEGLRVRSQHYELCHPLSQLVSTAASHDLLVLNFTQDQMFWITIPFEAFENPHLARSIASQLTQMRPPVVSTARDLRRMTSPEAEPLFEPQGDFVPYSGELHDASSRGTELVRASRRIAARAILSLVFLLLCTVVSFWLIAGGRNWLTWLMLLWLSILIAVFLIRSARTRRKARGRGGLVSWYSKGWVDEHGYCSITNIGQNRVAWEGFDHHEITDQAIALYPHRADGCCCLIGKEQFSDESDWRRAITLVRSGMTP